MRNNRENIEHLTCALTGEPIRAELLGEGSMLYRMLGDACMVYAGLSVLVLGTVQPQTIQGLKDHEPIFQKQPKANEDGVDRSVDRSVDKSVDKNKAQSKRLQESLELVGGIIFGVTEQDKADAAFALRELHRKIRGHLADGSQYHAWQPDVWAHAWAGIFRGMIDAYEVFRGFDSQKERDEALLGFVEFGKVFGVKGVPETWDKFDPYWDSFVKGAVIDDTVGQIAAVVRNGYFQATVAERLAKRRWTSALKSARSLPMLRILRVGAMATFPPQFDRQLGIKRTLFDRFERICHRLVWKLVPKSLSAKVGPNSFKKKAARGGIPIWKKRFSRENLLIAREELKRDLIIARTIKT